MIVAKLRSMCVSMTFICYHLIFATSSLNINLNGCNWFISNSFLSHTRLETLFSNLHVPKKWRKKVSRIQCVFVFASPHYMLNDSVSLVQRRDISLSVRSRSIVHQRHEHHSFRMNRKWAKRKNERFDAQKHAQIASSLSSWQMVAFDR